MSTPNGFERHGEVKARSPWEGFVVEDDDVIDCGIRRRTRSESSPPTQQREQLSCGARQSVEFLLCEVLDDIVNLPNDLVGGEFSDLDSSSEILSESPRRRGGFRPWRSISMVGGVTLGVFVTVLLR